MRKLSDVKGDKALDFWIDILEPMTAIANNPVVQQYQKGIKKGTIAQMVTDILKSNREEIWTILSVFHGKPVATLKKQTSALSLKNDCLEIFNMEGFTDFFLSAFGIQSMQMTSGSPTENTEADEI